MKSFTFANLNVFLERKSLAYVVPPFLERKRIQQIGERPGVQQKATSRSSSSGMVQANYLHLHPCPYRISSTSPLQRKGHRQEIVPQIMPWVLLLERDPFLQELPDILVAMALRLMVTNVRALIPFSALESNPGGP